MKANTSPSNDSVKEPYRGMPKHPEGIGGFSMSFRAFGVLTYAALTGLQISCERLMVRGCEGRDATYSALGELRTLGLIATRSVKVSERWVKATIITEEGIDFLRHMEVPYMNFERKEKITQESVQTVYVI